MAAWWPRSSMTWVVERWSAVPGLVHGFGDRHRDPHPAVLTVRQVHGRAVHDARDLESVRPEGDGIVSDRPSTVVGVATADCVPVLLLAPAERVVAAVHSGWRGTVAGVVEAALERLRSVWGIEPGGVEAALGPAIGGCCYEIGDEVREAFGRSYGHDPRGFARRDGRLFLDLRTFLAARLDALGVRVVERVGPCSGCRTDVLCSYRKEGPTGRQLSVIGWR